MTVDLSGLDLKEVKERIKGIFLWPLSLKKLNEVKENKFELADLDEVIFLESSKFLDESIDKFEKELSLKEQVKLYCLWKGYSGLVESLIIHMPYADIAGTLQVGFKSMDSSGAILVDGSGEPYNHQVGIPYYFTNYHQGYKGLPVKEKT